ncbi:MAG TPA: hypothetical protein DEA90_01495 [Opitutae bacterium]|nr:hypothetical protein [Puniceicoccaceae bacterium]HBR92821.1 hypothetical protein [Opitutae bacterium]|tara:strand:+ start:5694 stop:6983 length:1290 start_codon:yes stop_codon:yes gene_type:complete
MLSSFFIRNFRSILELHLDFTFEEGKAPNGYKEFEVMPFLEAANKQRLVPCMGLFGANAAGKTNILKGVDTVKRLLIEDSSLIDLYEPNLLNPKFTETTFEIVFIIGSDTYSYRITYSSLAISEERLTKNGAAVFNIQKLKPQFSSAIQSATYSKEKLSDILHVECSDGDGHQTKPFLRCIGKSYPGLHQDTKAPYRYFQNGINFIINDDPMLLPIAVDILASVMGGDQAAALDAITDVVRRADIEIAAINISETELGPDEQPSNGELLKRSGKNGPRHTISITATHKDISDNPVLLHFRKHESDGTQRLAGLVGLILYALKTGGVFLVDELECSLHPLLMREVVLLFKKRRHNPRGAQLIFTTHNTDILDDSILRLSEIVLTRKTIANGTLVRRLIDAKKEGEDIRNVTNFRKQYLAGFYSGVPHPAL